MEKHSLVDSASIEAWIAEHPPDGAQQLVEKLRLGQLTGIRARAVAAHFERVASAQRAVTADMEAALRLREVAAAERSANAADRSARWALGAWIISGLSLLVAIYAAWK